LMRASLVYREIYESQLGNGTHLVQGSVPQRYTELDGDTQREERVAHSPANEADVAAGWDGSGGEAP